MILPLLHNSLWGGGLYFESQRNIVKICQKAFLALYLIKTMCLRICGFKSYSGGISLSLHHFEFMMPYLKMTNGQHCN